MENIHLTVKGMSCMGCVASVKNLLAALPGVSDIEITLENGQVSLKHDPRITPQATIRTTIEEGGYEVA